MKEGVIASEAKQSRCAMLDCFVAALFAMTDWLRRLGHPLLDDLVGQRAVQFGQVVELGLVGRESLALLA